MSDTDIAVLQERIRGLEAKNAELERKLRYNTSDNTNNENNLATCSSDLITRQWDRLFNKIKNKFEPSTHPDFYAIGDYDIIMLSKYWDKLSPNCIKEYAKYIANFGFTSPDPEKNMTDYVEALASRTIDMLEHGKFVRNTKFGFTSIRYEYF